MIITKKYKGIRDYKKLRKLLLKEERWSFGGNESGLEKKHCIDLYIFVELCNSDKIIVALDENNNLLGIIAIDYLKRKKIKQILANMSIKIFSLHLTKNKDMEYMNIIMEHKKHMKENLQVKVQLRYL